MPKAKTKRGKGRPKFEPTVDQRRQVEMMAAFGNTEDQISSLMMISRPTLRLHFRNELDAGFLKANNAVAMNLFRQATKDDVRSFNAAAFWLKMRAGWHEYQIPPAPMQTKAEKLGKKEQALEDAKQPDTSTSMGELMAIRQASTVQ